MSPEPAPLIDKWLKRYLRWTHKDHLIGFIEGLTNLGRPSRSLFPPELLEQGLGIVLSGLNNTLAIQCNPGWVWPYWVERQISPDGCDFVPTGVNLVTSNVTHRNWTSVGLEDSSRESMVDPVGMLTPNPFGWSIFPYIRWNGSNYFPPRLHERVKQRLEGDALPCVTTRYEISPDLEWSSETMALLAEGEELISFRHRVANVSTLPVTLRFGLALRPYNPLTIGHINRIKYKRRLWRVNAKPGVLLTRDPDVVVVSDRHHGDPLTRDLGKLNLSSLTSRSGIACGVAEYNLQLAPFEEWTLQSAATIAKRPDRPNLKFQHISNGLLDNVREQRFEQWNKAGSQGLIVELPDKKIQGAFRAVRNHLYVFDDGDHFSPGTFMYHAHWFRDSAYLALAFENLGYPEKVRHKLLKFLDYQTSDGQFRSQRGEWDSTGQAIFTMVNHVRRSSDLELLDRLYPAILCGVCWVDRMRAQTKKTPSAHFGLLPAGISAEHFGPNDHYYWDNFWNLAGITSAIWAAGKLRRTADLRRLNESHQDYRYHLAASMNGAFSRIGDEMLPCSPYRWMDSAAIGNLVAVSPLNLIPAGEIWVRKTLDYLLQNNMRDELFFQRIIHTGLNPYLSAQIARVLLSFGNPRWFDVFTALRASASPTFTWPEAIHPLTGGGCMGDGDHGWSAAEFINLIYEMLVSEEGSEIVIGSGIPEDWFQSFCPIRVAGARTSGGVLDFSFERRTGCARLEWSIRREPDQDCIPVSFVMPAGMTPGPEASPSGKNRKLVLPSDEGRLDFEFEPQLA